ncbi:MAG: hydrogenase expression/formation C-terminal domain-containing protein [Veillonellales bacterium]
MFEQQELSPQVKAVLAEIMAALKQYAAAGQTWTIFLDKMALTFDERAAIRDFLGEGTVTIQLADKSEPVEWLESGIAGVWFGVYFNYDHKPVLETIEIGGFPQIAQAQPEDIRQGIHLLQQNLG